MKDFTPAHGMYPVLITPFHEDKSIDWDAYDQLVDWHIAKGVTGLFAVCGSSEYFHLEEEEGLELARRAVKRAAGRVHVLAGSSFKLSVEENIELTKRMAGTGVEGCFITTPPWLPDDDDQHLDYFFAIHDAVDFPLYAYEQPVGVGYKFSYDAVAKLAASDHYVGMKDTSAGGEPADAVAHMERKLAAAGDGLNIMPASSEYLLPFLKIGCTGAMTTAANVAPSLYGKIYRLFRAGDGDSDVAEELQTRITRVDELVMGYGYMRSAKIALGMMGLPITPVMRIDSLEFGEEHLATLREMVDFIERTEDEFETLS